MVQQLIKVNCQQWRKNDDGSWTTTQVTDVNAPVGTIRLSSEFSIKKGKMLYGVDVIAVLEQNCKN